jgi:hypothetical protein
MRSPLVRLKSIVRAIHSINYIQVAMREDLQWLLGQQYIKDILSEPRNQEQKRLLKYGRKSFSQNDEDGIIAEIFKRIGTDTKFFIEIGTESGMECNTRFLLHQGWRGAWVEASPMYVEQMRRTFADEIKTNQIEVVPQFVTPEFSKNVLMSKWPYLEGVDLFSIDIDGIDYHIVEAMGELRARLVIVEYNAKYSPPIDWVMPLNTKHAWDGSDYFGASLNAWHRLLSNRGYVLVGCGLVGNNAFFVRSDLVGSNFCEPFTPDNHYEPARYWTGAYRSGHPVRYRF